ncbi:MAG: uL15 family ribosomal protein, partial [Planctomycetota bacterium]
FNNRWATTVFAVNVGRLNDLFDDGSEVTLELMVEKNVAKGNYDEVKILGDGELTKKLTVSAHRFSKSAEEKITAAGGTINKVIAKRTPAERVEALKAEKKA